MDRKKKMTTSKKAPTFTSLIKGALLLFTLLFLQSCLIAAGLAAGGAGVAYVIGEYKENKSASMNEADEVVRKTLIELQYMSINHTKDNISCLHLARSVHDKKVSISLKAVLHNATSVKIRIGIFGDEAQSRLIMDKIRHNL